MYHAQTRHIALDLLVASVGLAACAATDANEVVDAEAGVADAPQRSGLYTSSSVGITL